MTQHIVTSREGAVLHIRLNRPEKKNALTGAMYLSIADAIDKAEGDSTIRAITLSGTGDSFSSGNDVADFLAQDGPIDARPVGRFMRTIAGTGKPLIAGVNGMAVGIGVTMLLHCDIVHAASTATFQLPFTQLGLAPEAASSLLLPRLAGYQRAAELMLLGERFSARTAREIGLVAAVHSSDALPRAIRQRATELASRPPAAIRATKALMKRPAESLPERIAAETAEFDRLLKSPDAQQILQGFLARRKAG